jgi:putative FmdB family regulatory protein
MPLYDYKCSCGKQFETLQSMNEEKLVKCNQSIQDCEGNMILVEVIRE